MPKKFNDKLLKLLEESHIAYYWIGFILADGGLHRRKDGTIDLFVQLASIDKNHLEKLSIFLNISTIKSRRDSSAYYVQAVNKKILEEFITKFNLILPKTYNCPDIKIENKEYLICLLIGFIDGDGSITTNCYKYIEIGIKLHQNWINFLKLYLEFFTHGKISTAKGSGYTCKDKTYIRFRLTYYPEIIWLKQQAINFNLPILERKWERIDMEFVSVFDKYKGKSKIVEQLYNDGLTSKEIINQTLYDESLVYRIIRKIKNNNKSSKN